MGKHLFEMPRCFRNRARLGTRAPATGVPPGCRVAILSRIRVSRVRLAFVSMWADQRWEEGNMQRFEKIPFSERLGKVGYLLKHTLSL